MKRGELPVLLAIFLDMVGFGMAIPDVQLRAEAYSVPGWLIGLLLSSYFIVQFLVSPRWGKLSDRIGRKPVLVICTSLSALSMVFYALIWNPWGILAARILGGLAAANVVVGQAYLADLTTEAERPAVMGRSSTALLLGLVAGPAIGGDLATRGGPLLMGLFAASCSALAVLAILAFVPYTKPTEMRSPGAKRYVYDISLLHDVPALRRVLAVAVSGWFVLACLEGTFGRLIHATLGYGQREFGWIFSYESLFGAGVGLVYAWLASRISVGNLLRFGFLSIAAGVVLTPIAPNFAGLVVASSFWALGLGVANSTINTHCSEITPEDRQGELFGLIQSSRSIGFIVGPVLGGAMFDLKPQLPYYLAAIVALLAAAIVKEGTPQRTNIEPQG